VTATAPDRAQGRIGAAVGLAAGLAVLAPVLGRGFVLSYDLVFVPDPPITAAVLGADGSVPRAVPTELVADLLATLLPAWLVQQAVLLAVFVLAGWGVARLVPSRAGAAAAALAYAWTPYLAERLVIGHWTYLLGYALLPWVTGAALAARRDGRLAPLLLWLGAAAVAGATAALLATGTALAVLSLPGRRRRGAADPPDRGAVPADLPAARAERARGPARVAAVLGFAAVANAAWLLPSLTRPGGLPADPAGVPAFAARADTPLGLAGSLGTLGGIWNPAAWPAGRHSVLAVVALAAVAAALALGLRPLLARTGPGLLVAAVAALVLAAAGAVPVLDDLLTAVVDDLPGGGLLRDGQKLLAPAVLLVALAAGHAVAALAARRRTVPYAVLLGLLPVVALPTLGWGVGGRLAPADYPPSWTALRAVVTAAPPGEVASLPWTLYRRLDFAGDRVVLDPLPRLLDRRVLVNDDLMLSSTTVRGEDARSALVSAGLAAGRPLPELLRGAGVRYAVVLRNQPGAAAAEAALAGLPVRLTTTDLLLVELPGEVAAPPATRPWVAAAGLGLTAVALAGAAAAVIQTARRPRLLRSPAGN
jgi:hypothetical protein